MNSSRSALLACSRVTLASSLLLAGCADFGAGGTGERVIPRETLRDVARSDLSSFATTAPATLPVEQLPTTLPVDVPATISLSIEDARQSALENNLELRVERLSPTIARERLNAERAKFEAVFTTDVRYATLDRPTASQLASAQAENFSVTPGVTLPLVSGSTITLDAPFDRVETNNQFSTLNPASTAGPGVTFDTPLLRGFGVDANAESIRLAFYADQQSQARAKLEVIRVLASVDRLYWRVYAARKALEVRRAEFDLAAALLQRNRRRLAARIDPEVEVLRAESALADRLEGVQTAENNLRLRERELKRALNRPDLPMDGATRIELATDPAALYARLDAAALTRAAILNRMELLDTELQLLADTARIGAARNGLLPLASLTYTYRVSGLGETFDEAFSQASDNRFADNTVGLRVSVPIGNEAARSRLRSALVSRMQTLATKAARQAQVTQEVLDSLDSLELARENISAAQRRVILARRVLEAESRLLDAGQRTSTDVLDAQSRLAAARLSEVVAVTSYQIAQVDVAFASGTLLGAGNIAWEPVTAPNVPRYIP